MSEVKWIKITTDIFDDDKILLIESLPECDSIIVIWFKLLCFAGKTNNSGVFLMGDSIPYTDGMLATIFRRKEATVKMALDIFERFGMIERLDGIITLPNWNKHQTLDAYERKKLRDREYQANRRSKQKALIKKSSDSQKIPSSDIGILEEDKEEDKDKRNICVHHGMQKRVYDANFESFWSVYPRKKEKAKAYQCYNARLNDGFSEDELLTAASKYAEECRKRKTDERYIKLGSTFLGANTPFVDYLNKRSNADETEEYRRPAADLYREFMSGRND